MTPVHDGVHLSNYALPPLIPRRSERDSPEHPTRPDQTRRDPAGSERTRTHAADLPIATGRVMQVCAARANLRFMPMKEDDSGTATRGDRDRDRRPGDRERERERRKTEW